MPLPCRTTPRPRLPLSRRLREPVQLHNQGRVLSRDRNHTVRSAAARSVRTRSTVVDVGRNFVSVTESQLCYNEYHHRSSFSTLKRVELATGSRFSWGAV